MTLLLLVLAAGQAALLLWAAVHLSNVVLRGNKARAFLLAVATLLGPLAIAHLAAKRDLHRILPGIGDCLVLVATVACVRVIAVNKEQERIAREHSWAARAAAEAAEAARKAEAEAQIRNAAASLGRRGMTLVEVVTAMGVVALVSTSLIGASILNRRLTEVAIYSSSVTAIMQGYLEQIKNMPYDMLPLSPAAGTSMSGSYSTTYVVTTQKDDVTSDTLVLSPLSPLRTSDLHPPTVPSGVYDNSKTFDVNRAGDLTVHVYLWVEDKTPSGTGATQQAKAITLLYMWQFRDGNATRSYTGVIKNLRSLVPTY
jgi:prepilin-type N-terminal cleavage/methylation domain-containing protein